MWNVIRVLIVLLPFGSAFYLAHNLAKVEATQLAKAFNRSNCWVCSQLPVSPNLPAPWIPIPLNVTQMVLADEKLLRPWPRNQKERYDEPRALLPLQSSSDQASVKR